MTGPDAPGTAPGPIESATSWLLDWLAAVTGGPVVTAPPVDQDEEATAGISVWPLTLVADRELRTAHRREPLRFRVRHLVTATGRAENAARQLDRALVAAVEAGEPSVELAPLPDQTWLALRCLPRPAVLIDVFAQIVRPMPDVPIVREPLRIRIAPEVSSATAESKEA